MSNWCWWEWGFKFILLEKRIEKLPLFNPKKVRKLYKTIEEKACNPHDDRFEEWGWLIDFIKANYIFCIDLIRALHWTTILWRLFIFLPVFTLLNLLWWRFFNWTNVIYK